MTVGSSGSPASGEPTDGHRPAFHVVASTGRTATSFLADCLDRLPGVAACHEGHRRTDDGPDLLPMINLENQVVFRDPGQAARIVAEKRSPELLALVRDRTGCDVLIDSAYYNAGLLPALLAADPSSRAAVLIRDCESFVRSATWLEGTDPMPVGWPDPAKELSARERFISMGRARPVDGPDADAWPGWGAIERNIWLWRTTNRRLAEAHDLYPGRVGIVDFGIARRDGTAALVGAVVRALGIDTPEVTAALPAAISDAQSSANERRGGYQIGCAATWSTEQQAMLHAATTDIASRIEWTN